MTPTTNRLLRTILFATAALAAVLTVSAGAGTFACGFVWGIAVVAAGAWLFSLDFSRIMRGGNVVVSYLLSLLWRIPVIAIVFFGLIWLLGVNTLGLMIGSGLGLFAAGALAMTGLRKTADVQAGSAQ